MGPARDPSRHILGGGGRGDRSGFAGREGIQHDLRRHARPGEVSGQQLDVLIAGDDETAKERVAQLVSDGGLRPIDVGPLARAQQLEHLGFLHISLEQPRDLGYGSTVKLHP